MTERFKYYLPLSNKMIYHILSANFETDGKGKRIIRVQSKTESDTKEVIIYPSDFIISYDAGVVDYGNTKVPIHYEDGEYPIDLGELVKHTDRFVVEEKDGEYYVLKPSSS